MRYYKNCEDSFIVSVGTGPGYTEVTLSEYNTLMGIIQSRPSSEPGFDYKLKEDFTWELVEAPVVDTSNEEISAEEALDIILGGVTA